MKTKILTLLTALAVALPAFSKTTGDFLFTRFNGTGNDPIWSTPSGDCFLTIDGSGNLVWVAKSTYQTAITAGTTAQFYRGDKTFVTLNAAALADTKTGTGNVVLATSPTLTSPTFTTPVLGTPSSGTLTNCTGLPVSSGISGLASGAATFLGTPSSSNLRALLTDESGTGAAVFATTPTLTTPVLGDATASSLKIGGSISDVNLPIQIFGSVAQYSVSRTTGSYGMLFGSYDSTTFTMRSVTATDKISFVVNNTNQALNIYPSGGVAIGTLTDAGSTNLLVAGSIKNNATTASTSSTTGALITAGGAGVAGDVFTGGKIVPGAQFRFKSSTVAGLPASPAAFDTMGVTDASAPAVGSTVTGGGSAKCLVTYNGTNWIVISLL